MGIIADITLRKEYLGSPWTFKQDGQIGHFVPHLQFGRGDVSVRLLTRHGIGVCLRDMGDEGLWKIQFHAFVHHIHLSLTLVDIETVGDAVVVSTEIHADTILEGQ